MWQQQLLAYVQNPFDPPPVSNAWLKEQGTGLHGQESKGFDERADLVVPRTADSFGGWCEKRRLEAVAYPTRFLHADRREPFQSPSPASPSIHHTDFQVPL